MDAGRFDALSKGLAAKGRLGGALGGFLTVAGFASAAAQDDEAEGEADDEGTFTAALPPIGAEPAVAISGDTGAAVDPVTGQAVIFTVEEEEAEDDEAAGDETPSLAIADASGGDGNVATTNDLTFFVS